MPRGRANTATTKDGAKEIVNTISAALEDLIGAVESLPDAFTLDDVATLSGFLVHRLDQTSGKLRLIVAKDVRGASSFEFGMKLPADEPILAPQTPRERLIVDAAITTRLPTPPAAVPVEPARAPAPVGPENAVPAGRLLKSAGGGKVFEPEPPKNPIRALTPEQRREAIGAGDGDGEFLEVE